MARQSFYDVLEVSAKASPEAIHAAYERLHTKYGAGAEHDARSRMRREAVEEAFATLSDPLKRMLYDQQRLRWTPPQAALAATPPSPAAPWSNALNANWPIIAIGAEIGRAHV